MSLLDRLRRPHTPSAPLAAAGAVAADTPPHGCRLPDPDDETDESLESVREHLERLVAEAEAEVAALSPAQFDAALTARLVGAERIQSTGLGFSYASRFADHVHEVLTLALPGGVVALPDSRLAGTGRRVPSLVNRGRDNLLSLLGTTPVEVRRLGDARHGILLVVGDSPYTASFARFLGEGVRRWLPGTDDHNGFVFALPHRHAILLQPCTSPAEVRDALELVPHHARRMHAEGVSPVSVHAYHWLGRQITCLTTEGADGVLVARPDEVLQQLLEAGGHRRR